MAKFRVTMVPPAVNGHLGRAEHLVVEAGGPSGAIAKAKDAEPDLLCAAVQKVSSHEAADIL